MTSLQGGRARPAAQLLGVAVLAALTAFVWYAWLGWSPDGGGGEDHQPWQVAGCLACLAAALAAAQVLGVRPWLAAPAMTAVFTVAWTVHAASTDDSGLFAVGAVLVLIGMTIGTGVVASITNLVLLHQARRRR